MGQTHNDNKSQINQNRWQYNNPNQLTAESSHIQYSEVVLSGVYDCYKNFNHLKRN